MPKSKVQLRPVGQCCVGLRDSPDVVAEREVRARHLAPQYHHWAHLWLMMPTVAFRLAAALTTAIPDRTGRGPLLGQVYVDGAEIIDTWATSVSTRTLVQDAVRALFSRCLDAAHVDVYVDGELWNPREHGPLATVLQAQPSATVTVEPATGEAGAARDALHYLLREFVYCDKCRRSLRMTYEELMRVKEVV